MHARGLAKFYKSNVFVKMAVFALGFALAQPASAELLQFELTGSRQASFQIDINTSPDFVNSTSAGDQIGYDNVPGTYGGVTGTAEILFGTHLIATLNIVLPSNMDTLGFTQFAGPDLFSLSGAPPQPMFKTGTFALSGLVSGSSSLDILVILEPSTWAMMLIGFGGLGFAGYRQMRRAKPQAA